MSRSSNYRCPLDARWDNDVLLHHQLLSRSTDVGLHMTQPAIFELVNLISTRRRKHQYRGPAFRM